jgi:hypothetical protein
VEANQPLPDAFDGLRRGDRVEHGVVVEDGQLGHARRTIPSAA